MYGQCTIIYIYIYMCVFVCIYIYIYIYTISEQYNKLGNKIRQIIYIIRKYYHLWVLVL